MCKANIGTGIAGVVQGVGQQGQALGQYQGTLAEAGKMEFDSYQLENNADLAKQQEESVRIQGEVEKDNITRTARATKAQGRVAFAAAGIELDEGTALDWEVDLAESESLQKSAVDSDVATKRHGLQVEQQSLLASAHLMQRGAKSTRESARLAFHGQNLGIVGTSVGKFFGG